MNLYEINVTDERLLHVVARSYNEAVDIAITFEAARGLVHEALYVEELPVENLEPAQEAQVRAAFVLGLCGVAHFSEEIGWTFSAPLFRPTSIATGGDQDSD